jgi:hypothetical protein
MALVERTAAYLDGPGRTHRHGGDPHVTSPQRDPQSLVDRELVGLVELCAHAGTVHGEVRRERQPADRARHVLD